jgi:hypothetical protein
VEIKNRIRPGRSWWLYKTRSASGSITAGTQANKSTLGPQEGVTTYTGP